jgi:hypothetical protein
MAKRAFRFPICIMLLTLLCVSSSALADNVALASAKPDIDRTVLSFSGLNNKTELLSLSPAGDTARDWRFISELCSFACEFQPAEGRFAPIEISWSRYHDDDYRDFGRSRGKGDFYWRKHPSTVPEPSSLTLLGTGVLVIAFSLRKRLHQ